MKPGFYSYCGKHKSLQLDSQFQHHHIITSGAPGSAFNNVHDFFKQSSLIRLYQFNQIDKKIMTDGVKVLLRRKRSYFGQNQSYKKLVFVTSGIWCNGNEVTDAIVVHCENDKDGQLADIVDILTCGDYFEQYPLEVESVTKY
jgi:hypothetical protein